MQRRFARIVWWLFETVTEIAATYVRQVTRGSDVQYTEGRKEV